MKIKREYPLITVSRKAQLSIENGHPWVYCDEIRSAYPKLFENGCLVDVVSEKNQYLGTGIYSEKSKIRVRLLSDNANDKFDTAFFERRIQYAWDYRKAVMGEDKTACRVIFGEADKFPGLTVDLFNNIIVTQTLSLGMDKLKNVIFPLIVKVIEKDGIKIDGIFERNDVAIRELEGLKQYKGWFLLDGKPFPQNTITQICENGIIYEVDVENGQKTGFFLDQKYNRKAIWKIAKGKRVLDCFTHTGSFAMNAAIGGALHVTAVDISESAVQMAESNAKRNNIDDKIDFICTNVFDLLPTLEGQRENPYNFIILDPPAFTKSRKTINSAYKGYKEINFRAMKILPRGGFLATCSCSHFMEDEMFVKMLKDAAKDAKVELRQIEARQQAPDHPILLNVPETDYLKFYIFQIV